jgi:hypothetical protein
MAASKLELSRRWIGAGFFLFALSSIANLISLGTMIFHLGLRLEVQMLLDPVSALLTLMGWLFLTRYQPRDSSQSKVLVSGFLAFALQFAALGLGQLLRASSVVPISRTNAPYWLTLLGYFVATLGFLLAFNLVRNSTASSVASSTPVSSAPPSSRLIFAGYAIIALSLLMILYFDVSNQFFAVAGFRNDVQTFTQPVAALLTAVGWWFLSRLDARDGEQQFLIHQAYWALGLALAANAIQEIFAISEVSGLTRFTWELWINAVGYVVAAVGFILTARGPAALARSHALPSTA